MAQPATNPKIEELRFRLKTDPKSRLFYQLAEELRRGAQYAEAERVLRQGLVLYPTYLAAWVSLGRVLREQKNEEGAVEALNTALQLDPGNVVAARLLGDAYLALGEKVEAIKKYKLVHAILPTDEELLSTIERMEREIHPPPVSVFEAEEPDDAVFGLDAEQPAQGEGEAQIAASPELASTDDDVFAAAPEAAPFDAASPFATTADHATPEPEDAGAIPQPDSFTPEPDEAHPAGVSTAGESDAFTEESPFDQTAPPFTLDERQERAQVSGDDQPMARYHDESPFEEPAPSALADALEIESPVGIHVEFAPGTAEVPSIEVDERAIEAEQGIAAAEEADVFAPAAPETGAPPQQVTDTLTMADLYAKQGLIDEAKTIYQHLLARDPENDRVREKLAALTPAPSQAAVKVQRLERWLMKVSRREVNDV